MEKQLGLLLKGNQSTGRAIQSLAICRKKPSPINVRKVSGSHNLKITKR